MANIATPEPVLYVDDDTARRMGLQPEDIVTSAYQGKYAFLHNKQEVSDLRLIQEEFKRIKRGKSGNEVNRPIVMVGADGVTPTLMVADNDTDAHEVQDILGQQFEKQEDTIKKYQSSEKTDNRAINTDWVRVVNGLPIGNKRVEMVHDAFVERMEKHKKNPVSDPPRDPWAGQLPV